MRASEPLEFCGVLAADLIVFLSRLGDFIQMRAGPEYEALHRFQQCLPQRRQAILHFRRGGGINLSRHVSITFKIAQRLSEAGLGDGTDGALDLHIPARSVSQGMKYE